MANTCLITFKKTALSLALITVFTGCTSTSEISARSQNIMTPDTWANNQIVSHDETSRVTDWLGISHDPHLAQLIELAVSNNFSLQASALDVELAKSRLSVNKASDFPELSLNVNQRRAKSVAGDEENYSNDAELSLQLSYELDLWGKLSDQQQQAELQLASVKAQYHYEKVKLVANVAKAWFSLLASESLLSLYQEREINLLNNLEIIKGSYRLGLSSALDVYLTQNDVSLELARISEQAQTVVENKRILESLVGHYPTGNTPSLHGEKSWPVLSNAILANIPSALISQRADLQSSWFDLLAADSAIAVAHKQRFPQFSLSASTGDSSDELANLLSGQALAWSLLGNITTPLFNAGRLASLEQQARITVKQKEQQYLNKVYQAFAEAENALSNHTALNQQLAYYKQAEKNAVAAESLAFNQYQKGLVSYATVLESQRRAFDAQTAVIRLNNELVQNRISVYTALGGNELIPSTTTEHSASLTTLIEVNTIND